MISNVRIVIFLFISPIIISYCQATSEYIFNDDRVLDFCLEIDDPNFWNHLLENFPREDYLQARFLFEDAVYEGVGLRIKGNTSASVNSYKKPFKIKFDEFNPGQRFFGLQHINLNNSHNDPTFMRDKLTNDLFREFIPAPRCAYARLFINGELWGLYITVEQIESEFLQPEFNESEGNLFKAGATATLEWLGSNQANYFFHYDLKNNLDTNDWSNLVQLIYQLDNPNECSINTLDNAIDLDHLIWWLAVNTVVVNLESYQGTGHNYYLYQHQQEGRFHFIPWDSNEAFGVFNLRFGLGKSELIQLPLTWLSPFGERPLLDRIFETKSLLELFYRRVRELLTGPSNSIRHVRHRIEELESL